PTASKTARAAGADGVSRRCTSLLWQASRSAIESAWPRRIAASRASSLRDGSGSPALAIAPVQIRLGRSAVKATSIAGIFARLRMHPATARLNGSFGACNFADGVLLELIAVVSA